MNKSIENNKEIYYSSSTSHESAFNRLYEILKMLRSPEGCPWDRDQTPETFYKNLIEESYEYIDAFIKKDIEECAEELGDMYLVISMLTIMHEEMNHFSLTQVLDNTSEKLVRRHPHVFRNDYAEKVTAENPGEVIELWNSIKENIEGKKNKENVFAFIPASMPNVLQAVEIQKKAKKYGFDWERSSEVYEKIREELNELSIEVENNSDRDKILNEFGDILFSLINYARFLKIDPDEALFRTNTKFKNRFTIMADLMIKDGIDLESDNDLELMDTYWDKAKKINGA
ncbi:MAG: nucleoside triphosphate pyrophosphohydrolase [Bacteroidetes bacterium]|nr:nucleoside triphosphate pyrophosphohydrolase [Bacteroidota bacterium]